MSISEEFGRRYTLSHSIRAIKQHCAGEPRHVAHQSATEIPGGSMIEIERGAHQHGMLNIRWQLERYLIFKDDLFTLGVRVA